MKTKKQKQTAIRYRDAFFCYFCHFIFIAPLAMPVKRLFLVS